MTDCVCIKCAEYVVTDPADFWCPNCQDKTGFAEVQEPAGITRDQYVQICRHFTYRGVIHRATRMRRLSELCGRAIHDYWDLTEAEAADAVTTLGKWAHGRRT